MSAVNAGRLQHAALWLAVLLAAPSSAPAQQLVATGHALDNSLQLGSGGYNGTAVVGGRIDQSRYQGYGGGISALSTFFQERMYDPARSTAAYPTVRPESGSDAAQESASRFAEAYAPTYTAAPPDTIPKLTPEAQKQMEAISYGVGYLLGEQIRNSLKRDQVDANADQAVEGFRDGIFDNSPRIPAGQMDQALADTERDLEARVVKGMLAGDAEFKKVHDANLRSGRAFQDEFGRRPGVVTLPDGLQYRVVKAGSGPSPGPDDVVVVNYRALLLDGTVVGQGQSQEVRVASAIPGAAQVLQMMNVGAKWLVALPPELAHGAAGKYPDVGPNETLFGEVELLEIKPHPEP